MAAPGVQKVLEVRHWTDSLFSFKTTRNAGFRFENGQFVMVGLEVDGRPLMRAYSMASANYEDILEFFSIRVANGPLTSRLGHIDAGDEVLVGSKPTGTLLQDNLLPGRRLYLFATGTGVAPFVSIIKDPDVYERFETVVLVHGCRYVRELAFGEEAVESLRADQYLGELVDGRLIYYPTVTREPFTYQGRVTRLIGSGQLAADLGLPQLDRGGDRMMICGSPAMLKDMCGLMDKLGFEEGSGTRQAHYVIEKAFVER
jgi:ferredoxin/flavodoxin---NADP+ reductase